MTPILEICLFGSPDVRLDGASTGGYVSAKAPALLAYLAVTGRPHSRDTLAALLWGEMADADAKNNLRQTLSNLRKSLESYLSITRDTVQFNAAMPHTLDVAQFENQLRRARDAAPPTRIAALQQAAALYQGDFLAGFYVRDAPEFEEWMLAQRTRYRELVLHALHVVTGHHLERGEYGRAIDSGTRLLSLDPWRETAYRQLMQALSHSGQRVAALALYETCRRVLDQELGVSPSAETTALYQRIKASGENSRHNLPPQPTPFVGRASELAEISALLMRPECRLITLLGAGGIGKTRLAMQAARQAARRSLFLDGIYLVSLEGVETLTGLATAVAQAIDFSFSGNQEPAAQLLDCLREQEVLLVLDNFEQLLEHALWLTTLLQQAPGLKLLTTSRERLDVQWEWCVMLDGLDFPAASSTAAAPSGPQSDLLDYGAVQLFVNRARAARHDFAADEATALPHIIRICRLTAGMPLALELAAANTRYFSCAEIADAIAQNLDFLATGFRDIPPRQRSVRAVFDYSWALLDAAEQRLFASLSVFRGGFTLEAATQVAGATRPLLAALTDKSLLRRDEGDDRYHLHEMARQYAADRLPAVESDGAMVKQHGRYFAAFLQQQTGRLGGADQRQTLEGISREIDNIRAAWQWATDNQPDQELPPFVDSLFEFYEIRSWITEGAEQFGAALAAVVAVTPTPALLAIRLRNRLSRFVFRLGRRAEAATLLRENLAALADLDAPDEKALALNYLGLHEQITGDYRTAIALYQESLDIYRATQNRYGMARALNNLGIVAYRSGDLTTAEGYLQESLALRRELNDLKAMADGLNNLGILYHEMAAYEREIALLQEALDIYHLLDDRKGIGTCLHNLGGVHLALGQYTESRHYLQQALSERRAGNDPVGVAYTLNNLGTVAIRDHSFDEAAGYLAESLELSWESEEVSNILDVLLGVAEWLWSFGEQKWALDLLAFCRAETQDSDTLAEAERLLARFSPDRPVAPPPDLTLEQAVDYARRKLVEKPANL